MTYIIILGVLTLIVGRQVVSILNIAGGIK